MAGNHPIHVHPVRPLYRYSATLLGASMWFFVGGVVPSGGNSGTYASSS